MDDGKFKLLVKILGVSAILLLLGYIADWWIPLAIGFFGALIFGIVFVFFVLPIQLQGQAWWRPM